MQLSKVVLKSVASSTVLHYAQSLRRDIVRNAYCSDGLHCLTLLPFRVAAADAKPNVAVNIEENVKQGKLCKIALMGKHS